MSVFGIPDSSIAACTVGTSISVSLCSASRATADCENPYSPNRDGDPIVADNLEQTVYYDNLTPEMAAATTAALDSQYAPLDTDVNYLSNVNQFTDVVVYDQFYSNGYDSFCGKDWYQSKGNGYVVGLVTCVSLNSVGECEKHELRYNNNYTSTRNDTERRNTACHEMGHTFGLLHSPNGCMFLQNNTDENLSTSDNELLNWWYDPSTACCDKVLNGDQSLTSSSGDWRLLMQGDGNLVGYHRRQNDNANDVPFWSSGTAGHSGAVCIMQGDGNLVIYWQGQPIWSTVTPGNPGAKLVMQGDRNIVIYRSNGTAAWNSATNI